MASLQDVLVILIAAAAFSWALFGRRHEFGTSTLVYCMATVYAATVMLGVLPVPASVLEGLLGVLISILTAGFMLLMVVFFVFIVTTERFR